MIDPLFDLERHVLHREIVQGEANIAAIDARIAVLQRQRDGCALTVARWRQELAAMQPPPMRPRFDVHAD